MPLNADDNWELGFIGYGNLGNGNESVTLGFCCFFFFHYCFSPWYPTTAVALIRGPAFRLRSKSAVADTFSCLYVVFNLPVLLLFKYTQT